jgi:hypothetical protein
MRRSTVVLLLLSAVASAEGCARGAMGPSASSRIDPAPRSIDRLSAAERRSILARAQVWRPIDTARLNLISGPAAADGFPFDALAACDYHFPDKPLSGVTPKFECALRPGGKDVVKVKYGETNGEVYAEVASSRLFWALGFVVDRMYPVKVLCRNCPPDPFKESKEEWHLGKSAKGATRRYETAVIERDVDGEKVEVPSYEGWAWPELEFVDEESGGAPPAHIDALKLLAVFVQHVDNKPEQQAIVCTDARERRDRTGNATCAAPILVVKDLGSTFGGAKLFNYDKMKLDSWREVPIWRNPATCEGDLSRSLIGNLEHPTISEAGRRFLATRLLLLGDRQLHDLFTAARVERRGDTTRDADGHRRPVTVADWVDAFKVKRGQIVNHRCPA